MLRYPVKFISITSLYGKRTFVKNNKNVTDFHYGLDLGWHEIQNVPIYAVEDGIVQSEGMQKSDGAIYCILYHEKLNMISIYWHLSKTIINKGDVIKKGQQIGNMGNTGYATATHLHYELWANVPKGYILNWKDQKKYCVNPIEYTYMYDDQEMHEASKKFPIKKIKGTPIARNTKVDQMEILIDDLNARDNANGKILGYINKGVYNILSSQINGKFTWYQLENNLWVAYNKDWNKLLFKEIDELAKLKKENTELKIQVDILATECRKYKEALDQINKISKI